MLWNPYPIDPLPAPIEEQVVRTVGKLPVINLKDSAELDYVSIGRGWIEFDKDGKQLRLRYANDYRDEGQKNANVDIATRGKALTHEGIEVASWGVFEDDEFVVATAAPGEWWKNEHGTIRVFLNFYGGQGVFG